MTFLSPIAALIAAAITLPVLIAMFLLKLRRKPVRVSSTMLWDQAVKDLQANVPFRWLRPSWMLLLSVLILASLLLALARPALDATAARAQTVVLVIDRSASMNAHDLSESGDRLQASRLDLALERAGDELDQLERSGFAGVVAVVAYAADPVLIAPATSNLARARRSLATITPTDQPGDLAAALTLVETLVQSQSMQTDELASALAVILSDGQATSDTPLTLAGAQPRFIRVGPSPASPSPNLGIVALAARRAYDDPGLVRLFVRIQSTRPQPAVLTVTLDGAILDRKPVVFEAPAEPSDQAGATVVQAALALEVPGRASGDLVLTVERAADSQDSAVPDALDADNAAGLALSAPQQPAILLVRANPDAAPTTAQWILTDILDAMQPRSLRVVDAAGYRMLAGESGLALFDLVIFEGITPGAVPPIPSISFGAPLPAPGPALAEADDARAGRFLAWARDEPIMRAVALDQIIVRAARVLPDAPGLVPLARDRRGTLIGLWRDDAVGHLVVGFDLEESSWPVDVSFAIFLANAIDDLTLTSQTAGPHALRTTDPIIVEPTPGSTRARVLDASGTAIAQRPLDGSAGLVTLGALPRVGAYTIQGALPASVRINLLDERESSLATADTLTIAGQPLDGTARTGSQIIELWPWLVLIAGVLAVVEWILHGLRLRV